MLGADLRVVGLAGGASSVLTGLAFIDYDTFARAAPTRGAASYVLVWPRGGDPDALARRLERDHALTVQTREQFSGKERQVVSDMSTGLIRGMLLIGMSSASPSRRCRSTPRPRRALGSAWAVARAAAAAALIAVLAALVPARPVAGVDPASVYRR